jgi:neutral trehalase
MPLFGGLPSEVQSQRLIQEHLLNQNEYAPDLDVRHWVTTTARSEPAWEPQRYWRGPVWIIMNWFVIEGLQRYGYDDLAKVIRQDTLDLIQGGGFREYYDARTGSGCGSSDFSWSAALTLELSQFPL